MVAVYDGYVSRYMNRRISDPIAKLLARTRITPNQVSWAAFCLAALSFLSFIYNWNIAGGLLAQLSSVIDGVDGSLARLKVCHLPLVAFWTLFLTVTPIY